jgi:OOP family OmpA-OmpF porin
MNMKFAAVAALALVSLTVMAPGARAADNGFYLGAGITDTKFDVDDIGSGSLDDNSFKLIAGFRPLDWLAFEANYMDLGGDKSNGDSLDASAITLSGLVLAEIGIVDLYARLGVAKWDADISSTNLNFSESDDGWEPTYGVGVGVHFGSIGVRAEYERFEAKFFDALDADVGTVSLSFTYTFL